MNRNKGGTKGGTKGANNGAESAPAPGEHRRMLGRNRIYMGSLPQMSEQEIMKLCEPFGKVVDSFCQPAKGFAFITMDSNVAATLMVEKLDKSVVKHRTIRAKRASPNAAIEVEELTPSVTNELLVEAFSAFGGVERAVVRCDYRGNPTGSGIVEFKRANMANSAIENCKTKALILTKGGKPVRVKSYIPDEDETGQERGDLRPTPEISEELSMPPHFSDVGTVEHMYATKWMALYGKHDQELAGLKELQKQEHNALAIEMRQALYTEERRIQGQMEYNRQLQVQQQQQLQAQQAQQQQEAHRAAQAHSAALQQAQQRAQQEAQQQAQQQQRAQQEAQQHAQQMAQQQQQQQIYQQQPAPMLRFQQPPPPPQHLPLRPGTYGQIDHSSLFDQHQQPSFGGLMSPPSYGGGLVSTPLGMGRGMGGPGGPGGLGGPSLSMPPPGPSYGSPGVSSFGPGPGPGFGPGPGPVPSPMAFVQGRGLGLGSGPAFTSSGSLGFGLTNSSAPSIRPAVAGRPPPPYVENLNYNPPPRGGGQNPRGGQKRLRVR